MKIIKDYKYYLLKFFKKLGGKVKFDKNCPKEIIYFVNSKYLK